MARRSRYLHYDEQMVSPQKLYEVLDHVIGFEKDLVGKRILVSAGPTREALDSVRFLTNHPQEFHDDRQTT